MTMFRRKAIFLKILDVKPLNICKKHFQTILLTLPLDECEIQGKYTVAGYNFFIITTAIATAVYARSENDYKYRSVSTKVNSKTLYL